MKLMKKILSLFSLTLATAAAAQSIGPIPMPNPINLINATAPYTANSGLNRPLILTNSLPSTAEIRVDTRSYNLPGAFYIGPIPMPNPTGLLTRTVNTASNVGPGQTAIFTLDSRQAYDLPNSAAQKLTSLRTFAPNQVRPELGCRTGFQKLTPNLRLAEGLIVAMGNRGMYGPLPTTGLSRVAPTYTLLWASQAGVAEARIDCPQATEWISLTFQPGWNVVETTTNWVTDTIVVPDPTPGLPIPGLPNPYPTPKTPAKTATVTRMDIKSAVVDFLPAITITNPAR